MARDVYIGEAVRICKGGLNRPRDVLPSSKPQIKVKEDRIWPWRIFADLSRNGITNLPRQNSSECNKEGNEKESLGPACPVQPENAPIVTWAHLIVRT